jgi:hypothetical protein
MVNLTKFNELETEQIVFSNSFKGTYRTMVPIGYRNENGDVSPCLINTPSNLLSFGIQEITNKEKNTTIGYQMPICLWGKKRVSDDEKLFTEKIEQIVERCKDFLRDSKEELEIDDKMIDDINLLSWKHDENGNRVQDKGPLLYTKLMINSKNNKIMTLFVDEENSNTEVEPYDLLNQNLVVTAALKLENIVIGKRITIQMKLYEVLVKKITKQKVYTPKSILKPGVVVQKKEVLATEPVVEKRMNANKFAPLADDDENEESIENIV